MEVTVWLAAVVAAAAEDPASSFDPGTLAQYGVLGVFAVILLLFAKTSYKRETDRADRLEAEVTRLNNVMVEKVIPLVASSAQALDDATNLLRDQQREREAFLLREQAARMGGRWAPDQEGDRR